MQDPAPLTDPAAAPPRLPADQAVRDRITGVLRFQDDAVVPGGPLAADPHVDLDANLVVAASAGSGKTHALVWRMTALVRAGVDPASLVAITFTRKAAGEMRARFYEALGAVEEALARHAALGADEAEAVRAERAHVRRARARVDDVFIDTIHAFCARLLRERGLEIGLPPGFATLEDRDEAVLRRRCWNAYLARALRDDAEAVEALEDAGLDPADLYAFFGALVKTADLPLYGHDEGLREPAERPDLAAACEAVEAFVRTWQARRRGGGDAPLPTRHAAKRDALMTRLDEAEHLLRLHGLRADADRVQLLELFASASKADTRKGREGRERGDLTQAAWKALGLEKDEVALLQDEALPALVQDVVRPALEAHRAWLYPRAAAFARRAVEGYAARRRAEGQLTFQDLLLEAARLLRRPDVQRHAARRYRHLLVDEFQDTDPVQAEVLFRLTHAPEAGDAAMPDDWRRCRPRPGSLFIVGDAKQSIYRFRRADISVFEEVCALLRPDAGGDGWPLQLTTNFRSLEAVCGFCNDAMAPAFTRHAAPYQTAYADLRAFRDARRDAPAVYQLPTANVKGQHAKDIAADEAERIAAFIRAAVRDPGVLGGKPAGCGDFLILARLSKRLPLYAQALEAAGLPYVVSGGKALGTYAEVQALAAAFAWVRRPDDGVAALAHLRGLFCGLSDADLYRARAAGATLDVQDAPPEAAGAAYAAACGIVRDFAEALRTGPASAAVAGLLERTGLLAHAACAADGSSRAGALLRVRHLVEAREQAGLHWTEIADELQRLVTGEAEADEWTLETGSGQAVRLMTVHQAKGLQARVVFLVDPYDNRHSPEPDRHVGRTRDGRPFAVVPAALPGAFGSRGGRLLAAPRAWQAAPCPDDALAPTPAVEGEAALPFQRAAARYAEAEHARLVYVAATRAEDVLVVSRYEAAKPPPDDGAPDAAFWRALCAEDADLPELPRPAAPDDAVPPPPLPDLDALLRRRDDRLRQAAAPTYRQVAVAARAKAEGAGTPVEDGAAAAPANEAVDDARYGRHFGTAMHALFEAAVQERAAPLTDDEAGAVFDEALRAACAQTFLAERLAAGTDDAEAAVRDAQAAWTAAAAERARRAWAGFAASPLWAAVRAAPEAHAEVRLMLHEPGPGVPTVASGTLDLVYGDAAGWTLVDYKTDRFVDAADRARRLDAYARQTRAYADAWRRLTGHPVRRAALYLVDAATLVDVPLDG